uniref:Pre-B-cell leukemia homeobox interacting protein 1b n=1 Tax=Nothobranchius korthausae TaxID=1143690 RepID=A0A1A8GLY0_9TELE
MSGAGGTNNSWTILTSEESVAETLRPFAAGAEQHGLNQTPAPGSGGNHQPGQGAASAEGLPETCPGSEDKRMHSGSSVTASLDVPSASDRGDGVGPAEGQTENPAQLDPDPESLLPPSPDPPPPGGAELTGEKLTKVENLHLQHEEFQQKGEESEHHPQTANTEKRTEAGQEHDEDLQLDHSHRNKRVIGAPPHFQSSAQNLFQELDETTVKTGATGAPEERRKKPLLAALEQIGRREEDEEDEEEEFHLPQQENSSIFSLNKCILGAVILLGFGIIFFSESDHAAMELKDAEPPRKQGWFHPDADTSELLDKLAEGNQQISALQAQLQAQKEELKVLKEQAAEGEKERLLWEEVDKENSRLKTETASLPVLQKENDRMKKELESVPVLQKELETLRGAVTKTILPSGDFSFSTSPPTGQPEHSSQATAPPADGRTRKSRDDRKEKKEPKPGKGEAKQEKKRSKERERSARKGGEQKEDKPGDEKGWKKGKHEGGTFDKRKEKWQGDEIKEGKKERGEDGKPWKEKESKKEWKKGKVNEWRDKEKKEHQGGMSHGERHKGWEERKGETEWSRVKEGMEGSGREKWKKKEEKDHPKEGRGKSERKQVEDDRERTRDERKSRNEERWKKDESLSQRGKEEWKRRGEKERRHGGDESHASQNREERLYGDPKPAHSHPRPSVGQPEYWLQRRDRLRLRRRPTPPQHCYSPESCAQAERLLPVGLLEFQNLLQPYLSKAEEAGVDVSQTDQLRKLAADFFTDGVFVHDQMSFRDFVEDLGDVLEDLVEGDDGEDSDVEDEMEEFEKEVMKAFLVPGVKEKERKMKGEWKKERG